MAIPLYLGGFLLSVLACVVLVNGSVAPLTRRRRHIDAAASSSSVIHLRRAHRPRLPSVSVVIPALNEGDNVAWVLTHLPRWVSEVVLVDGLSVDHTEIAARDLMPSLVVVHQPTPGKGAALRAGFAAASGEIIVMIDADGSTNPGEMRRFVDALQDGADFVKGSRALPGGGSEDWTRLRRAGNRGFVLLANLLYGSEFTDICYGYCAFWRRSLNALALTTDGFEIETQLALNAVKAGLRIREVPSFELERRSGVSNLNAYRDGIRVLLTLMDERVGRDSRGAAEQAQIFLKRVELASPGSDQWVPAGRDLRRNDRRVLDRVPSGYTGPECRKADRRSRPRETVVVYRVIERPVEREETALAVSRVA